MALLLAPSASHASGAAGAPDAADFIRVFEAVGTPVADFWQALKAIPADIANALAWGGSGLDWLAILGSAALLIAAGTGVAKLAARSFLHRPTSNAQPIRRWGVMAVAFVLAGGVISILLPLDSRVRALALSLFFAWAFTAAGPAIVAAASLSLVGKHSAGFLAAVRLSFAVAALAYLVLGLMILANATTSRVLVAILFWGILVVLFVRALQLLLASRGQSAAAPSMAVGWHDDPVRRLFEHHPGAFMGATLGLIALATPVRLLRHEPGAFVEGVVALQLLAATPVFCLLLPKRAVGEDSGSPWRFLVARAIRILMFVAFWLCLALLFHINLFTLASDRIGQKAFRILIDAGLAVVLGLLIWQVASTLIDTFLGEQVATTTTGPAFTARPASRLQTFVPLLRAVVLAFIVAATGMIVLASVGVNIGPLLAGAGIFGIAIGFGSQALVKDVISGLFFLYDDAFRIGEYVEVDKAKGTIEGISVRSLRIRHSRGAVYTVPFGHIGVVNNQSRDWSLVKLEFLVDFDTDLRQAKRVVKQIATEIEGDPDLAAPLLAPLKFQGVRRMEPYGIVVGVRFTSRPGEQYVLQREIYARIRDAFAAAGIQFARPRIIVTDTSGREVNSGAARAAAMQALQPPSEK